MISVTLNICFTFESYRFNINSKFKQIYITFINKLLYKYYAVTDHVILLSISTIMEVNYIIYIHFLLC